MWGYSGLTGNNANVFKRLVRGISFSVESTTVELGAAIPLNLDVTYYTHDTKSEAYTNIIILSGEDIVEIQDGNLVCKSAGEVTFILTYETKVSSEIVTFYTQPITLTTQTAAPVESDTTEPETTAPDEPVTDDATEPTPDTSDESGSTLADSETEAPRGGCSSAVGSLAILLVAGAAVMLGKKKD